MFTSFYSLSKNPCVLCQHFIATDAKAENNKDFKDAFHRSFFRCYRFISRVTTPLCLIFKFAKHLNKKIKVSRFSYMITNVMTSADLGWAGGI